MYSCSGLQKELIRDFFKDEILRGVVPGKAEIVKCCAVYNIMAHWKKVKGKGYILLSDFKFIVFLIWLFC
jgi:hypothetical protein